MKLDFLNQQHERMKKIGAYSLLFRNSISKRTWDKFQFAEGYEQDNLIISVLLFIMEQSLKEEICTMDHITMFIDELNSIYYKKSMTYEDSREMAEFIVNVILGNEGRPMYFKAMNYKKGEYEELNITFIRNKIEYVEGVRRVTYYISDDGYELILSTLEVEESLKITIQEIIFKMHLKKASYDKAVEDIKGIFNKMRSRIQRMEDDIRRIKESPLTYSIEEYREITEGNLETLRENNKKFILHKESIEAKIKEFEDKEINIRDLTDEENENLRNLRVINEYLGRAIDEEQKILIKHFDLKNIYSEELENISKMSLIERFDIKKEVYNKVLGNAMLIDSVEEFLKPIFLKKPLKKYNINKAFTFQTTIKDALGEDDEALVTVEEDMDDYEDKKKLERIKRCNKVIKIIFDFAVNNGGSITLGEIKELIKDSENLRRNFFPTVEIFREVIVEMIKARSIDIEELREERRNVVDSGEIEFQLMKSILEIIDDNPEFSKIKVFNINKIEEGKDVKMERVLDENGEYKNLICSDLFFETLMKRSSHGN